MLLNNYCKKVQFSLELMFLNWHIFRLTWQHLTLHQTELKWLRTLAILWNLKSSGYVICCCHLLQSVPGNNGICLINFIYFLYFTDNYIEVESLTFSVMSVLILWALQSFVSFTFEPSYIIIWFEIILKSHCSCPASFLCMRTENIKVSRHDGVRK